MKFKIQEKNKITMDAINRLLPYMQETEKLMCLKAMILESKSKEEFENKYKECHDNKI